MVKPSRHRRPPLSPLPLSPKPSVMKHGSSPQKKRLRSPITQCCSSQILTSSEVESDSVSDKFEIQSLKAKVSTAQASGPPPDEFESLRPPGDLNGRCDLQRYKDYLESFYKLNKEKERGPVRSVADAAFLCLEKENHMGIFANLKDAVADYSTGDCICKIMFSVLEGDKARDEGRPYGIDAALCLAKEAELIIEWLKRRGPYLTNEEYIVCRQIRSCVFKLFVYKGNWWSIHIAACLLGIRKEAERLIENLRLGSESHESIATSLMIRRSALAFIKQILDEYESQQCIESDDDSDDDDDGDDGCWYN